MSPAAFLLLAASAKIAFFGDAQFDRGFRTLSRGGDPTPWLAPTRPLRDSADWAVLNLETPLCDSTIPACPKRFSLRSDPTVAKFLSAEHFTHAILANNHSMDRGLAGLASTIAALRKAGVAAVGASTEGDPCRPVVSGPENDRVSFLALVVLPGVDSVHLCADPRRLRPWLRAARSEGKASVVSVHWGREGSPVVEPDQRALARTLADWGATAVVGHHAHVVQEVGGRSPSLVGGIPVWYGVGNFVFDQYEPWTRRALVAWIRTGPGKPRGSTIELRHSGTRSIAFPISRPHGLPESL